MLSVERPFGYTPVNGYTLATHLDGILAYYDHRISTGPLEGTNNKIKTIKNRPTASET